MDYSGRHHFASGAYTRRAGGGSSTPRGATVVSQSEREAGEGSMRAMGSKGPSIYGANSRESGFVAACTICPVTRVLYSSSFQANALSYTSTRVEILHEGHSARVPRTGNRSSGKCYKLLRVGSRTLGEPQKRTTSSCRSVERQLS